MLAISPINNQILVMKDSGEDITEHGIVTAQIQGERTESRAIRGTVLKIPDGLEEWQQQGDSEQLVRVPIRIKVGDRVLIKKWDNHLANIEGKEYILVQYKDILATLEEV